MGIDEDFGIMFLLSILDSKWGLAGPRDFLSAFFAGQNAYFPGQNAFFADRFGEGFQTSPKESILPVLAAGNPNIYFNHMLAASPALNHIYNPAHSVPN